MNKLLNGQLPKVPVQEHVGDVEVEEEDDKVEELADEVLAKVPRVAVEDAAEEPHVLLDDGIHDHGVVVLVVEHDRGLGLHAELLDEATLARLPDLVRQHERARLDHHDKGHPLKYVMQSPTLMVLEPEVEGECHAHLVVGGVGGVVRGLDTVEVDDAFHVLLVFWRDIR